MIPNQDQLQIISNCPVCNSKNFPGQIRVLSEQESGHLLHIKCRKCQSNVLVLVTFGPQGVASAGVLTDLTGDEVVKFSQGHEITTDEILELHQLFAINSEKIFDSI